MTITITHIGESDTHFDDAEAEAALLACGFSPATIEDGIEILATYSPPAGVNEIIVFSSVGIYAGNNADGWNDTNSVREIGELSAEQIDELFGEGQSTTPIWISFLAKINA